ncbi:MAG: GNAT family N-acetyltransferase [Caulobacterales bacterium]
MNDQRIDVQRATTADLGQLGAIDPRLGFEADRATTVGELLALGESWIATVDGRPAGYVLASRHFFGRPFVDLLVVAEDCRRRGVGAALMARCEAAHDDDRLFTSTNESNAPMRALLARAGYEPSGIIQNLDPGDPELVFVKFRPPA